MENIDYLENSGLKIRNALLIKCYLKSLVIRALAYLCLVLVASACSLTAEVSLLLNELAPGDGRGHKPEAFIFTLDTRNISLKTDGSYLSTKDNQFRLPLVNGALYDFQVDWGDGNEEVIKSWDGESIIHTYDNPGVYNVTLKGVFEHFKFCVGPSSGEFLKILDVKQWGPNKWKSMESMFQNCQYLKISAEDAPDLSEAKSLQNMFFRARTFNSNIAHWDVSNIEDMSALFQDAHAFNSPLSKWNTSKVRNMNRMFMDAYSFNQPIGSWNASQVRDTSYMFRMAHSFNQPLTWDTSQVTDMTSMFSSAGGFNQPLNWNTSRVTKMVSMFENNRSFNQDLSSWRLDSLKDSKYFDSGASAWRLPRPDGLGSSYVPYSNIELDGTEGSDSFVSIWRVTAESPQITLPLKIGQHQKVQVQWGDGTSLSIDKTWTASDELNHNYNHPGDYKIVISGESLQLSFDCNYTQDESSSKILDIKQWGKNQWNSMEGMFCGCSNLQITAKDAPDLSQVKSMAWMFSEAKSFNSNISHWDLSKVEDLEGIFAYAPAFNQPLRWNTQNVLNMNNVFAGASAFNQPLDWKTSRVQAMRNMFSGASAFNQPLKWDTSRVEDMSSMFNGGSNGSAFNQSLEFDTSQVVDMSKMFYRALSFNAPSIGKWNTEKVQDMESMFGSTYFNQSLGDWKTLSVKNMASMFENASLFNQPIGSWDTGNVTDMSKMFSAWGNSSIFNQYIGAWNTSSVTRMDSMFENAKVFNQNLADWNVDKVTSCRFFSHGTLDWLLPHPPFKKNDSTYPGDEGYEFACEVPNRV